MSLAPIIKFDIIPSFIVTALNFTTTFINCTFRSNYHSQVLGVSEAYKYYGALITYQTNYKSNNLMYPTFSMISNNISDNYFLGSETSLIYIMDAIVNISLNNIGNNGYIGTQTYVGNSLQIKQN